MKLKAILEVSVLMIDEESIEEANDRATRTLIDVCDEWLNNPEGLTPYIKIEYDVDNDFIKDIKLPN